MQLVHVVIKYFRLLLFLVGIGNIYSQNILKIPKLISDIQLEKVIRIKEGKYRIKDGVSIFRFHVNNLGLVDSVKTVFSNQEENFNTTQADYFQLLKFIPSEFNSNFWFQQKINFFENKLVLNDCDKLLFDILYNDQIEFGNKNYFIFDDTIYLKTIFSRVMH